MKSKTIILFLLSAVLLVSCTQNQNDLANEASELTEDINKIQSLLEHQDQIQALKAEADALFKNNQPELGKEIWCATIPDLLSELKIDAASFATMDGSVLELEKINQPIFLQVTEFSDRYPLVNGYNQLVKEYGDRITFITLLIEDERHYQPRKNSFTYDPAIHFVFNQEIAKEDGRFEVSKISHPGFVHQLGFPFNYYISADKEIIKAEIGDLECQSASAGYFQKRADKFTFERIKENLEFLLRKDQ